MMILTLAQRELRSLFLSPLAWSILSVVQLILAYLFLGETLGPWQIIGAIFIISGVVLVAINNAD